MNNNDCKQAKTIYKSDCLSPNTFACITSNVRNEFVVPYKHHILEGAFTFYNFKYIFRFTNTTCVASISIIVNYSYSAFLCVKCVTFLLYFHFPMLTLDDFEL